MKFGFRVPSFRKRIAARTSWKRVVRHNLGLKAPRGWGWVTNPKKAAYNRVYNKTTVGVDQLLNGRRTGSSSNGSNAQQSSSGGAGVGCFIAVLVVVAIAGGPVGWALATVAVVLAGVVALASNKQKGEQAAAELVQRQVELTSRFDSEVADCILAGKVWQGATIAMIVEALGAPADVKERVLKTKTKHTYCYYPTGRNRFGLKVHFEDGVVVGWDEK
ncbi:MAG: hypothetical protein QM756_10540 [Polyangiaceae bacterium]